MGSKWIAVVAAVCAALAWSPDAHTAQTVYVQGGAVDGDGSKARPFGSLRAAQDRSEAGATIYVLASEHVLDGGIRLKPNQKLIGVGESPSMPTMTLSSASPGDAVVALSTGNEVAGIAFVDLLSYGIRGAGLDGSGVVIRDNTFVGSPQGEYAPLAPNFAIMLEADGGEVSNVSVTGNSVRDGATTAGIQVQQRGASTGSYHFKDNHFDNLPGRAYHLWSQDDSALNAAIVDSSADNIGVGDQNSDSILPHVSGRSTMTVLVKGYRYRNTNQVGNPSNCGLEAFVMGPPFEGESLWCRGCTLNLTIEDSVFENPVTDGIQLINFGTDARLDIEIRGSRVVGADPQQVGGGISLLAQNEQNRGSRTRLLIEDTEVIDSTGFGFALSDVGDGYTAIVDLGGGALGSRGNNRIVGSAKGEVSVIQGEVVARNNWWGGKSPRTDVQGERSKVTAGDALAADPSGGR